jgi:hypothetical protein
MRHQIADLSTYKARSRPSEPMKSAPDLPDSIKQCGHDYLKSMTDNVSISPEVLLALKENEAL